MESLEGEKQSRFGSYYSHEGKAGPVRTYNLDTVKASFIKVRGKIDSLP